MKSINYCRCFIMSELKYLASKNGLKYKIVRFEAGPEGKRAKINQKAATVDFTVYPARFEPILELTKEELEEISAFTRTMETELESAEVKEFILRYREGLSVEIISKATGGCPEIIADLVVQSINTLSIKQMRTQCLQASISSGRSPVPHSLA